MRREDEVEIRTVERKFRDPWWPEGKQQWFQCRVLSELNQIWSDGTDAKITELEKIFIVTQLKVKQSLGEKSIWYTMSRCAVQESHASPLGLISGSALSWMLYHRSYPRVPLVDSHEPSWCHAETHICCTLLCPGHSLHKPHDTMRLNPRV